MKSTKYLLLVTVVLCLVQSGIAQTSVLSGKVVDEFGDGLPGVNIFKKGTSIGTATDFEGNFQYEFEPGDTIIFSFVGYEDKSIIYVGETQLEVRLNPDLEQLAEVVVIGYGVQKKSDLTGATGVLSTKDIDLQPIQRVENVLQGKVAGVFVQQNSGAPGAAPKVNIRGFSGNPTYVIDGFIDADINAINPNDIESISVLKDASATAIYGSRGANGVILIKTKSGKKNSKLKVDGEYYHTVSTLVNKLELLDPVSYMQIVNKKLDEAGALEIFSDDEIDEAKTTPGYGTNWQDEIFQVAHSNNLTANVSKGWEKVAFRVSIGGRNDDGIVKNSNYKRFSSRLNLNADLSKLTSLEINGGYTYERLNNVSNGNRSEAANRVVAAATAWSPNLPVIDPVTNDYQGFVGYGATVRRNPVYQANEKDNISNNDILNIGINLRQKIIDDLSIQASYSLQKRFSDGSNYSRYEPATQGSVSELRTSNSERTGHQANFQIDYNKDFGQHNSLSVVGVAEFLKRESFTYRYINVYNPDNTPGETVPANDPFDFTELGQISFLARANYDYMSKLIVTGSIRVDGSSRLPENNKWDSFYSGAIAYRISDEKFMNSMDFLEDFKIRVGYGEVGNVNSLRHAQVQNLTNPDINGYVFSGTTVNMAEGFEDGNDRANPVLVWEKSRTWNAGLDMVLWSGKIELNADYYEKYTEESHFNKPVPAFLGGGSTVTNSGRFKNSGVELNIIHQLRTDYDFDMRTSVSLTFNQSKVIEMPFDSLFRGSRENGFEQQSHVLILDQQLGQMWGYEYLGTKVDGAPPMEGEIPSTQAGDAIYRDINGDGQIGIDDMMVLGNGHPNFIWGLNSFINFKGFNLNLFVQGVHGTDVYNIPQHGLLGGGAGVLDATSVEILNSASFPSTVGDGTLPTLNGLFRAQSSLFIEDASFIRIKNITLGYNLPDGVINKLNLNRFRIYAGVQNLATFSDYTGYDPESKSGSIAAPGIDRGSFPVPRTYTIGLNISY